MIILLSFKISVASKSVNSVILYGTAGYLFGQLVNKEYWGNTYSIKNIMGQLIFDKEYCGATNVHVVLPQGGLVIFLQHSFYPHFVIVFLLFTLFCRPPPLCEIIFVIFFILSPNLPGILLVHLFLLFCHHWSPSLFLLMYKVHHMT